MATSNTFFDKLSTFWNQIDSFQSDVQSKRKSSDGAKGCVNLRSRDEKKCVVISPTPEDDQGQVISSGSSRTTSSYVDDLLTRSASATAHTTTPDVRHLIVSDTSKGTNNLSRTGARPKHGYTENNSADVRSSITPDSHNKADQSTSQIIQPVRHSGNSKSSILSEKNTSKSSEIQEKLGQRSMQHKINEEAEGKEFEFKVTRGKKNTSHKKKEERKLAKNVDCEAAGICSTPKGKQNRQQRTILLGTIVRIFNNDKGGFGFIKPFDELPGDYKIKDIHFYLDKISSGNFPIKVRDKVSFTVNARKVDKPFAATVTLVECCQRSDHDIRKYLDEIYGLLQSDESKPNDADSTSVVVSLLHCPAVFKCIGNSQLSFPTIRLLISTLLLLRSRSKSMENILKSCLLCLMKSTVMNPWTGNFNKYIKHLSTDHETLGLLTDSKQLFEFVQAITVLVPEKARTIVSLMKPVISESPIEQLLYSLLKTTSRGGCEDPTDLEWDELPLVPSVRELLGDPAEGQICLQPVIRKGPYRSSNDYMDIYFRLLRSDCFGALQAGVQKLARGEQVDQRDMKVYFGIKLAGIYLPKREGGFAIALQFIPKQRNIRWNSCSNLMYGNLLCISMTGTFRDPVWATVYSRDTKTLEKTQTIFVELCSECNMLSDADVLALFSNNQGQGIMVESPTYYKAYQPVLQKLQSMDPEDIPFQDELVHVKSSQPLEPQYLEEDTTVKTSRIYDSSKPSSNTNAPLTMQLQHLALYKGQLSTALDEFQLDALIHMLQNRVALVQGPPGTGKTFIGIKLLLALLTLSTVPNKPILVLTYKNHALDEFLKDVIKKPAMKREKVIRIGGRSQDDELAECNLTNILRTRRTSKDIFMKIKEKRDEIFNLRNQLVQALKDLQKAKMFQHNLFIKYLDEEQLFSFMNGGRKDIAPHNVHVNDKKLNEKQMRANVSQNLTIMAHAFSRWYPSQTVVDQVVEELGLGSGIEVNFDSKLHDANSKEKDDDLYMYDEEDIENMQQERMAAAAASANYKEVNNEDLFKLSVTKGSMPMLLGTSRHASSTLSMMPLLQVDDLWKLPPRDRVKLIQAITLQECVEPEQIFQNMLKKYQQLCLEKNELEMQDKVQVLSSAKVIGMTISGASIHHKLIAQVEPAIVLVEEAAEILEAQLIAALGPWVQHLIMIGDHKQLRPSVESYILVKDYNFDLSMMERLIENKMPLKTLGRQNRMRPEISNLLRDIYPTLQDNMQSVEHHQPATCVKKSMFFWTHEDPETSGRSYTNEGEATKAVNLALFLMQQGYPPESITILAAYQGQVAVLRKKVTQAETDHRDIFQQHILPEAQGAMDLQEKDRKKFRVNIYTIDMYQGDENDFVIVSLVRSNPQKRLGFLTLINRRCVAQSRSRCGLYIIGNGQLLRTTPHWERLISTMEKGGYYGSTIELHCPKHFASTICASSGNDITLKSFCSRRCMEIMNCSANPRHPCTCPCQPPHQHNYCRERITYQFKVCGHKTTKDCGKSEESMRCKLQCQSNMDCGLHKCTYVCGSAHRHDICLERISYTCPKCSHPGTKLCHQKTDELKCEGVVTFAFSTCTHLGTRKCYQKEDKIVCRHPCTRDLPCKHKCHLKCGVACIPDKCADCEAILRMAKEKTLELEKQLRQEAKMRAQKELEELRKNPIEEDVIVTEIIPHGETAHEYLTVEDRVKYYVQPGHNWYPQVIKIEKITNLKLQEKWLQAKTTVADPNQVEMKFHGTSQEAIQHIIREGFILPKKPGMYGRGIYFATDSSKSAQDIYTKGSGMLLLCEIVFGRIRTVESGNKSLNINTLSAEGYDSVFAPRGSKKKGGVLYDEYVIFNPNQAVPRYIVHYSQEMTTRESILYDKSLWSTSGGKIQKYELKPKRIFKADDPFDREFRAAESQFLRLMSRTQKRFTITSVDLYINPPLVSKFKDSCEQMKMRHGDTESAQPILAFHGTKPENIDSIVRRNFDIAKLSASTGDRGWFGAGIYFSEFPEISLGYGNCLLLCKVLPGKSYDVKERCDGGQKKLGYDSHRVCADSDGRGLELVIFDADQILPSYVIHYSGK